MDGEREGGKERDRYRWVREVWREGEGWGEGGGRMGGGMERGREVFEWSAGAFLFKLA